MQSTGWRFVFASMELEGYTKMRIRSLFRSASAIALSTGMLSAQTVISASSAANNGAAPVGIAATLTPAPALLFTQPFCSGQQLRGAYKEDLLSGTSSLLYPILDNGVCSENYIAIAPGLNGFTAGSTYATGASPTVAGDEAVYKNGVLFLDGLTSSKQHAGITFDSAGTFHGDLIVTLAGAVNGYTAAGTLDFSYPLAGGSGLVLEGATVTPVTDAACPGCLYITAATASNIDNPTPSGPGFIFLVKAGTPNGTTLSTPWATTPHPEPEGIVYVDSSSANPACTLPGPGGARFSYFVSGYASGSQIDTTSATNGAILAYTPAQLAGFVGDLLVPEEGSTLRTGDIIAISQTDPSNQTLFSSTNFQLEGSTILTCAGGGCPATFGFWKHHPFPFTSASIGCVTYSASTLVSILDTAPQGGNAVLILAHQLIAAIANYDAGGKQLPSVTAAIASAMSLLCANNINLASSFVASGSALGQQLVNLSNVLDAYNSGAGLNCSEGSGLQ